MPTLRLGIDSRGARTGASEFRRATDSVQRGAREASDSVAGFENRVASTGTTAATAGRAVAGFLGVEVLRRTATATIRTLSDLETGLIGVQKTTDLTDGEIRTLRDELFGLATDEAPVATSELLAIAQAAGQLGVKGADNVLAFTETIAKLGQATDLSGERAAVVLARLLNVTGEAQSSVRTLGSVLVELGNNSAATEGEIADVAQEVGAATAVFGVSSAQAVALGATFRSFGVEAAIAGTSTFRALNQINIAVREGGDTLERFADIAGETPQEFARLFEEDAVGALLKFVQGLARLDQAGGDAGAVLDELGIATDRSVKALLPLITNVGVLERSLKLAADELEDVNALDNEASRAFSTLEASTQKFQNSLTVLVTQGFEPATDGLSGFLNLASEVVLVLAGTEDGLGQVSATAQATGDAIQFVALTATGLIGLKIVASLQAWATAQVVVTTTSAALAGATVTQSAAVAGLTAAWTGLTAVVAANPLGAAAVAVVAVSAAIIAFTEDVDEAEIATRGLKQEVTDLDSTLQQTALARARLGIAEEAGDREAAAAAIREQVTALESLQAQLAANVDSNTAQTILLSDLYEIGRGVIDKELLAELSGAAQDARAAAAAELEGRGVDTSSGKAADRLNQIAFTTSGEDALRVITDALARLGQQAEEAQAKVDEVNVEEELAEEAQAARDNLAALNEELRFESQLIGLSGEAQDFRRAKREILTVAQEAGLDVEDQLVQAVLRQTAANIQAQGAEEDRARAIEEATRAQEQERESLDEYVEALEFEASLVGLENDARREAINLRILEQSSLDTSSEAYRAYAERIREATAALTGDGEGGGGGSVDDAILSFQDLEDAASSAFQQIAQNGGDALDVIGDIVKQLAQLALQRATSQFTDSLFDEGGFLNFGGSVESANGNIFASGNLVPFQSGGVFGAPFAFPLNDGRDAIGAEAGPEALVPLDRTSDGKLGVRMTGGGGRNVTIVQNITTPDVGGFRRSRRQLSQDARRSIG